MRRKNELETVKKEKQKKLERKLWATENETGEIKEDEQEN